MVLPVLPSAKRHAVLHLLPEVLHEAVGARIQEQLEPLAPPAQRGPPLEVEERGRGTAVRAEHVRLPRPEGGHVARAERLLVVAGGLRRESVV